MKSPIKYVSLVLLLLIAACSNQVFAQGLSLENKKENTSFKKSRHQLGLTFSNFENIGNLRYFKFMHKYELKENLYLRTTLNRPSFGFTLNSGQEPNRSSVNFGAAFGIEKHIPINEKASFYYGVELGTNWATATNSANHFNHRLIGIAGINYKLSDRISIFGEFQYGAKLHSTRIDGGNVSNQLGATSGFNIGIMMTLGKRK